MNTWHIRVSFIAAEPFTEDTPFDISERLESIAAVMSVSRDFNAGSVSVTIDGAAYDEALSNAIDQISAALVAENVNPNIVSVEVQSEEAFNAELARPVYPEVVSYAEVAKMAGVSRQRARQLADTPSFPVPVIQTGQGPLFSCHAVEQWVETRNTRPGRPVKATV